MPNIGPLEIAIVLVVLLLIFGPKRLPGLGRKAGKEVRVLRDAVDFGDDEEKPSEDASPEKKSGDEATYT